MTHRDDSAVASLLLAQGETAVPILIVDWSGEDEPGQIVSFVRQRAAAFGVAEIEWTDEDTEAATAGAERGDHVPWLLTALDESIGSVGLALSLIASGTDQYEVVVSRLDDVAALRELHLEGSAIVGVGEEGEAQLVNVVCADCNAPHMWELSDGVTLDDTDVCEVCGAAMFDASGKALPGVVVS